MNTRTVSGLALLLTLAVAGNAGAATLALRPSANMTVLDGVVQVAEGGTVNLDLQLVLSEAELASGDYGLYGGAIVVSYDARLLTFAGFTPNDVTYFCDPLPAAGCAPIVTTSGFTESVEFGFDNAYGTNVVGTFDFTSRGEVGDLALLGMADADDFFGTFLHYYTYQPMEGLVFSGASVAIVPLPASVWLLGTAVAALATRRRVRHTSG